MRHQPKPLRRRAIKLTAVSTPDQAGPDEASLETQSLLLDVLAKTHDLEIVDHIEIPGFSRDFYNWPEFADAARLKGIEAGYEMLKHWAAKDFEVVLVHDGTRFARKESIFIEFYLRTRDIGAIIIRHLGGELTDIGPAMFEAYSSGQEMRTRKARTKMGMDKRFERGLPGGRPGIAHLPVRDAYGRTTDQYILNPDHTALWRDLATLLIEGVAWDQVEKELYQRFKHVNPKTGRPWARLTMHGYVLTRPLFWGHVARYHTYSETSKTNYATNSLHWLYDESVPLPAHVQIRRDVFPAVWTGETAEKVKAELRRRRDMYGRASPNNSHMFLAVCKCAKCGRLMSTQVLPGSKNHRDHKIKYVSCRAFWNHGDCDNKVYVPYKTIKAFLDALLRQVIEVGQFAIPADPVPTVSSEDLTKEMKRLETQIDALVDELSLLPETARGRVRARIGTLSERLEEVRRDHTQGELRILKIASQTRDERQAIGELRAITIEKFWMLDERTINQILKRILGDHYLLCLGKEIVRMV
jgi:DNA invertase Pin-like site-specific DNA recombinase